MTVTDAAAFGPALLATIVHVTGSPVPYGGGDAVLVIDRSASAGPICVIAVELLLPAFGSDADVTVAVLLLGPVGAAGEIRTVMVNVAVVPLVSVAMEQETVPVPPTGGLLQMNAGPVGCDSETNVVFGGNVSAIVTLFASDGPLFATVMLYVICVPAVAPEGAVLTTETSALFVTVVTVVGLFPDGFGSLVELETLAVFVMVPVAPGLMCTVIENVADPMANDAIVQVTVPVPPTGGLMHENVWPFVCDSETNVVFAGTASVSETLAALDGPLFISVMV